MQWRALLLLVFLATIGFVIGLEVKVSCEELQEEWKTQGFETRYLEQTLDIALLWNGELAHAGAALLRATLVAAGYAADPIRLYNSDSSDLPVADNDTLTVEVTMAAQLQVRLTPRAARSSACKNASTWSFYQVANPLLDCDFVSGANKPAYVDIYIVNELNHSCAAELIRYFSARTSLTRLYYLDQSNLTDLISDSDKSFLFLDIYQQSNKSNLWLVQLPPTGRELANDTYCAVTSNNSILLKYADNLLPETFVVFTPSLSDLYSVLNEYHATNKSNMEEAACSWALLGNKQFRDWQLSALIKPRRGFALAVICETESEDTFKELRDMTTMIKGYTTNLLSTYVDKESIQLKVPYYNCSNIDLMLKWSIVMFRENRISNLEGVILPENMAAALASYAAKLEVPLLTYDVNSGSMAEPAVRSATGNVKHLQIALRRLLAECGWQRIAIISEPTPFSKTLSAALQAPTARLAVREVNVTSSSLNISRALKELVDVDARVFLVNTAAATAAVVLAAAQKLNITRANGFVWIVREYITADNATSVTRPYSVSFWWRGERENKTSNKRKVEEGGKVTTDDVVLREKLEEKWKGRSWPLHAAPLLDALLTLKEGISRDQCNKTWPWTKTMSSFWNDVQKQQISGINQNLTYDDEGVKNPLIFVEQWNTEPRPQLLATWRGGEWSEPAETCPVIDPPPDGSTFCFIASGVSFLPKCWDIVWIPSFIMIILVGTTIIVTMLYCIRKALRARDIRIKTEFAKRLLARRERVFEALAENLVDRSSLELQHELGTGRFGRVHLGLLRKSGSKHQNSLVAAKALRVEASSAEESEFLREACTLATLDHEHIIRFIGVCVVDGPPLLLMEHAFFGDLLRYLQARRCLAEGQTNAESGYNCFQTDEKAYVSAKSLTKLAQEAATAIAYLARRGIVHRDLRASNCLIDERRSLKLADFGLARATGTIDGEYACSRRQLLPVLWMAPESLAKGIFSAASDVWSFGVLVFELVTLGRRPYGDQPPPTVLRHVLADGRPQLPWDASAETRALTRACWRREPEARPTPAQIVDVLSSRFQALRPALVTELVDIDSNVYGNTDCDLFNSKTWSSETLIAQQ